MKRAVESVNCSLLISECPTSSMKLRCNPADSLLRTLSTCVGNSVSLWELENEGCRLLTSNSIQNKRGEDLRVDTMCLGASSRKGSSLLACGTNDLSLQIFESIREPGSCSLIQQTEFKNIHESYLNDCQFLFSISGEYSVVTCSDDHTIRVWDVTAEGIYQEYRTKSVPISITTHKEMPGKFWVSEMDGTVKLYDKESPSPICTLAASSKSPFTQIDWNNQSVDTIGGVDRDKWYVWNWRAGKLQASAGTLCEASGFNWSYSHPNLFTVHSSSEVLLWDTDHLGIGCLQLQETAPIQDVTWLGDQPSCLIASGGNLIFWNINT